MILAGGLGSRYGQPKILAEFGPGTFLSHCFAVIAGCARPTDRVIVSVAHDPSDDLLRAVDAAASGAPFAENVSTEVVVDRIPASGPAHAIGIALGATASSGGDVIVMAVDMLGVRSHHLEELRQHVRSARSTGKASIVVAKHGPQRHWTLAAIPAELVPNVVRDADSVGSLHNLFQLSPVSYAEFDAAALLDVNTPDLRPPHRFDVDG